MADAGERARRLVLAGVLVVAAVACTGDDGNPGGPPADLPAPTVLRLGLPGEIVVDPVAANLASPSDQMVLDLLHDGLTRVDADGVAQPALAESWEHNDALTAWRFRLAPDAAFASGEPITAEDVIASIERVAALGEGSLVALALEPVTGFDAFIDGDAEHLAGLRAIDDTVVRFGLDEPLSVLPTVLAAPGLGVVGAAVRDGGAGPRALDLSGDWKVTGADDTDLELAPRADSALDGITLRSFSDADDAYDAFGSGEVDWATVPPERYADALAAFGDRHFAPFQAELFFGFNVEADPLTAVPLREAVEAAIDREAIVAAVYADRADPLATIVPAGVPGHDATRCGACGPDVVEARRLVAGTFPDGDVPTVAIDFDDSPAQETMARMIAADLDTVGIPSDLRPLSLEEYKTFVVSGDQQLFTFGWIGAYRSPDAYLAPLFTSDSDDNLTGFRSAAVDGYLSRARAADDPAKNGERWALTEQAVMNATVVVPIAQFRTQVVVATRVQGLAHAVDGTVDWAEVRLAP